MTDTNATGGSPTIAGAPATTTGAANLPVAAVEQGQARVGQLLAVLQESAPAAAEVKRPDAHATFENQLAVVRLGMATSLFYALRAKHRATAAHSLRVALTCSAWASRLGLDEQTRDRIEVAALLHDIGKIGIPDRILRKPGKLTVDEQLMMDGCNDQACEILRGCTSDVDLLSIVAHANSWFDSRRQGDGPRGAALPIGARMLAIANAFDAMTTDSVYRRAMSRERAIQELFQGSGTQFDPDLIADFSHMLEQKPEMLRGAIVDRWLQKLQPSSGDALWNSSGFASGERSTYVVRRETLFVNQLLSNTKDGVVFTDTEGTITQWNDVMHDLTGIAPEAILGKSWSDKCIGLQECASDDEESSDSDEAQASDTACLVAECLHSNARVARPMTLQRPSGNPSPVHVQVAPVHGSTPGTHGTVIIIRDMTDQAEMEEQLETLHHKTTIDPLTGVANRAHFDEAIRELVAKGTAGGETFSLIICDIDHFKRVNDVHGHPAGDEALVSFAAVLKSHSRDGDLVARYGGEEFLVLASKCDNATATHKAEAIRSSLEATALPSLGGEAVTASFGVTEFQPGDTAETVLSRADRALLKAKDNGRNRVIQFGSGGVAESKSETPKRSWLGWFDTDQEVCESDFDIVTPVPVDLAIEKLRGFIADHNAEIINVSENQVSLKVNAICSAGGRRRVDQQIALRAQLTLSESFVPGKIPVDGTAEDAGPGFVKSNVHINLQPIRNRDRRSRELAVCVDQVVASLRSYLMGEIVRT